MTTMAGEFFLNLIEQDQVWVTGNGRRMALEEMEWSHRRNVLAMLERQLDDLYRDWLTEFLDDGVTPQQAPTTPGRSAGGGSSSHGKNVAS